MAFLTSLFAAVSVRLGMLWAAFAALPMLAGAILPVAFSGPGTLAERLLKTAAATSNQRQVFSFLRLVLPNLVLSAQFVKAYPNTGTAIVSRAEDVIEVLDREADFEVVYEPKMRAITGGENFFLGMQDSADYQRDTSNMRLAVRRTDISDVLLPLAAARSAEIVGAAQGAIDLPADLTRRLPAILVGAYFGTPGPGEPEIIDWTSKLFWYLFIDLAGNETITANAMAAAKEFCAYLDATIAARKAGPPLDDILGRCLVMQAAGLPGMDDLGIRNNLFGLLIGFVPTINKACVQALNVLLDQPAALAGAQAAGRADNDMLLAAHIFEALRFDPINPIIYRRAVRDTILARSTLRARTIPKGTMVLAANLSAMFDPLRVDDPGAFRTDRPWGNYILWGYGMHTCFGAHINHAIMPQILKPLLKLNNLRRAPGAAGQIDSAGTPFPQHMSLVFDR
jgi:cytochrome P450